MPELSKFVLISSGPSPAIAGGDAVDYGAYTGGYGAFGWYSDHPNHEGIGHRRRRRSPQEEGVHTPNPYLKRMKRPPPPPKKQKQTY